MHVANKNISLLSGLEDKILESRHPRLMIKSMPEIAKQLYPDDFTDLDCGFGFHETGKPITRYEIERQLEVKKLEDMCSSLGLYFHAKKKLEKLDYENEVIREQNHRLRKEIAEVKASREDAARWIVDGLDEYDDIILDLRVRVAKGNDELANIPFNEVETRERLLELKGKDAPEDFVPDDFYFAPLYWDKKCARNEFQSNKFSDEEKARILDILGENYIDSILNSNSPFTVKEKRIRDLEVKIRELECFNSTSREKNVELSELREELVNVLGKDTLEIYKEKRDGIFVNKNNKVFAYWLIAASMLIILLCVGGFLD